MNNENILAVNIPNIISITLMAAVGFFVLAAAGAAYRRWTAKPADDMGE